MLYHLDGIKFLKQKSFINYKKCLQRICDVVTALHFCIAMIGTNSGWVAHVIKLVTIDTLITCIVVYGLNQFCINDYYKQLF